MVKKKGKKMERGGNEEGKGRHLGVLGKSKNERLSTKRNRRLWVRYKEQERREGRREREEMRSEREVVLEYQLSTKEDRRISRVGN